jgi:hypothetical protein
MTLNFFENDEPKSGNREFRINDFHKVEVNLPSERFASQ